MKCEKCKGFGIVFTRRIVRGLSGERAMREPGFCACAAGDGAAHKYEQNLKEGRAGMHGLYPQTHAEISTGRAVGNEFPNGEPDAALSHR